MNDCTIQETSLDVSSKLLKLDSPGIGSKECEEMQSCDYGEVIECLFNLASATSPDIALTANILRSGEQALERRKSLSTLAEGYKVQREF